MFIAPTQNSEYALHIFDISIENKTSSSNDFKDSNIVYFFWGLVDFDNNLFISKF